MSGQTVGTLAVADEGLDILDAHEVEFQAAGYPQAEEARLANIACYESPATTVRYVADRYHMIRRDLATQALSAALSAGPRVDGAVLEVGVGSAPMLDQLDDDRITLAADLVEPALRAGGARHRPMIFDATRPFPISDRSVAAALMGELIEHVYYPDALLREIRRVLKPGGVLVLTTPNLATLQDRIRFLFGRAPRQIDPLHAYLHLHIRPFTVDLLRQLLDATGFDLITVQSNLVGVRLRSGRWIQSRLLARLFPGLGGSLVVSARRREEAT
ncbi:ubiquinone/menaquinone biosynthesis C-methylase UbiE [Asanoa ferruginea]|uniref:Ubiquinone/menaquinone biosynthesis C-methylase UbiE n=1 Tax=Asanoa ferruginea TaxID=53367 RepID=A0A3D9ZI85_9ACTN|nr:class I SAM-dependent methyltransferase [Asanoa ferruginea]REF96995.1 ubiquinone/menaquinone biosynthesis C-methylase UbiE [Asanoa ferruginea]GIF50185.1 hypothetical protein Afe04nite_47240 [Asanoa ferruginea]